MSAAEHKQFWARMAERFGRAWYEERGLHPSEEWVALLSKYGPQQIHAALDLIERKRGDWRYPPTHSQVGAVLAEVAQYVTEQQTDHVREYWRSAVVAAYERIGSLLGLWPYGTRLSDIKPQLRARVLQAARETLDAYCQAEQHAGRRTPSMDNELHGHVWDTLLQLHEGERPKRKATQR